MAQTADAQLEALDSEVNHLHLIGAIRAHIASLPDLVTPLALLEPGAVCPDLLRHLGCRRCQHDPSQDCRGSLHPEFFLHDGNILWTPRMVAPPSTDTHCPTYHVHEMLLDWLVKAALDRQD